MHPAHSAIAVLVLCSLGCVASAGDASTASDPTTAGENPIAPVEAAPENHVQVDNDAKAVLERVTKHYAPFPGLKVVAKHRFMAPNRILHEQIRLLDIVKPNRFQVSAGGRVLATSDGNQCWMNMPSDKIGYRELIAPKSLPEAIRKVPVLGGSSIGGSGGIVAALLSPKPIEVLLRDASRVELKDGGTDDLLIIEIKKTPGTLRAGTQIGLFIPKAGPAWIAQADIIPPNPQVYTRIVFENWSPSDSPETVFELDPQALRTAPLPATPAAPANKPESN